MNWWIKLKRLVRFQYLRIIRLKSSAHSIAMGMAIGVFVGFQPITPFQIIVAVTLAFFARGNKIAAAIGTVVSNPINLIPFYAMLFFVGNYFLGFEDIMFDPDNLDLTDLLEKGWHLVLAMMFGGLILGIPAAILSYILTLRTVMVYRRRRTMRILHKKTKL